MNRLSVFAWLSISLTIVFTVVGQILVKKGLLEVGGTPKELESALQFLLAAFTNGKVVLGLVCAVIAAGFWTLTLSRVDLSLAYPFMALAIVLVLALSGGQLGEAVPVTRWLGVALVCLGLIVVSQAG